LHFGGPGEGPSMVEWIEKPTRSDEPGGMSEQASDTVSDIGARSRQKCEKPAQGRRWRDRSCEDHADI
jgi:hypothetical protein